MDSVGLATIVGNAIVRERVAAAEAFEKAARLRREAAKAEDEATRHDRHADDLWRVVVGLTGDPAWRPEREAEIARATSDGERAALAARDVEARAAFAALPPA